MTERPDLALHQMTVYGTKDFCIAIGALVDTFDGEMMTELPSVGDCPNKNPYWFNVVHDVKPEPCGVCRNCKAFAITESLVNKQRPRKVRKDKKQR